MDNSHFESSDVGFKTGLLLFNVALQLRHGVSDVVLQGGDGVLVGLALEHVILQTLQVLVQVIYLLLVVAWAIVYDFLELLTPGSFAGLSAMSELSRFDEFSYFSLVTITTLGYGDITPENLLAGITAGLQATAGVFYTAVLVASLVGDFMAHREEG